MEKLALVAAAAAGFAAPAFAGGLNTPVVEAAPTAPAPFVASTGKWDGFYGGVTAGSVTGGRATYKNATAPDTSDSLGSGSYGVFGGYNLQRGSLVYGGELALQAADVDTDNGPAHFNNLLDVKARLGWAYGDALPYAFVGYSRGQWNNGDGQTNDDADGVNYGLGVDYAVNDQWQVGAEFIRRELDTDFNGTANSVEQNFNAVQLRAAYRF
ncbi:opacity protein-like surface antigen [Rhodobacter sp. JA431]|uniref:outer membrane protein n=1 Tax=Rhodobacter sp. JA431 TaxID=570013 RepID=UPI000BCE8413|nr:porin family protein [Rhodobacter sp. JA431]SOB98904.1 opacity protein-like surface antigen [Rhodobacter sp. JA431]